MSYRIKGIYMVTKQLDKTKGIYIAAEPLMATELIVALQKLMDEHGDHPVMYFETDVGSFHIAEPLFDTGGGDDTADDCFVI